MHDVLIDFTVENLFLFCLNCRVVKVTSLALIIRNFARKVGDAADGGRMSWREFLPIIFF